MAKVPKYERQVRPEVFQAPQVRAATTDLSGLARGLSDLGSAMAQIHQREVDEANQAFATSTDTNASRQLTTMLYDPEAGILARKGANALGIAETAKADWSKYSDTVLAQAKTAQQRLIVQQVLEKNGNQLQRVAGEHEFQQNQVFKDTTEKSSIQQAKNLAALSFNDPQVIADSVQKIDAVARSRAHRLGLPSDQEEIAAQKEVSQLHASVISQIAVTDPQRAQAYLLANIGSMVPAEGLKITNALRPLVDRQTGIQVGEQLFSQAASAEGRVFDAMLQAESAGRQFSEDGRPLVSSKGATGIAQVMPGTGPEAAKAAGLPWDEDKLRTDPGYNKALGQAYFQKQMSDFGGVPALAVAAYNAGPGMVEDWINGSNKTGKNASGLKLGDPRKGEVTEAEFAEKIPFQETRDYVQKTLKAANQPVAFGQIAQQIDGREDLTPAQKDIAIADARERWQWQKEQQAQQYKQTLSSAWDAVVDGGRWQDIDSLTWSRLAPQDRKSIMGYNQNRETDPEVYTLARDLIVQGKDIDLLGMRGKLSNGDFKSLTDLQIKRQNQGAPATAAMANATTMFTDALRNAGLPSTPKPGSKDARNVAMARRYVDDQIQALEQDQGKKATSDQVQQIVDRAFIQGELLGSGSWWNGWQLNQKVRPFQLEPGQRSVVTDIDQVPAEEREKITAALQRAGLTVNDKAILDLLNESLR